MSVRQQHIGGSCHCHQVHIITQHVYLVRLCLQGSNICVEVDIVIEWTSLIRLHTFARLCLQCSNIWVEVAIALGHTSSIRLCALLDYVCKAATFGWKLPLPLGTHFDQTVYLARLCLQGSNI
eukprot:8634611-Ditylum_brightwellii.AAC.1